MVAGSIASSKVAVTGVDGETLMAFFSGTVPVTVAAYADVEMTGDRARARNTSSPRHEFAKDPGNRILDRHAVHVEFFMVFPPSAIAAFQRCASTLMSELRNKSLGGRASRNDYQ